MAIVQVKNEDSLLFYTSQDLPTPQVEILRERYGAWLIEKYGAMDKAFEAWNGTRIRDGAGNAMAKLGDDPAVGKMGLFLIWELTQERPGGTNTRLNDQLAFIAGLQRDFYADIARYYRDELGCRQLINAMNWKSADKMKLDDAERWTYSATDVIAVNRYTGGEHLGQNNGYRIDPGHRVIHRSVLKNPLIAPTNLKQVSGHPMIITESSWVRPNRYQSEGGMVTSAYMSLTGVDSLYWFSQGSTDYLSDPRRKFWSVKPGETGYALDKWSCATPMLQGMFPANALLFRKGYLKQGTPVVEEVRSVEEILDRGTPIIAETETFDPNRDVETLRNVQAPGTQVSRLAFLVGPVHLQIGTGAGKTGVGDLRQFIDGANRTVRSNTDEIALNWGTGILSVNAPKAQGVAGFLKDGGGKFELTDVTIESENEYAAIQLVSMDDRPLDESGKILVQVGTLAKLTGWEETPATIERDGQSVDGTEIVATGKPPYQVAETRATITLRNNGISKGTLLNVAGYPERDVAIERSGERIRIELSRRTMYLILE